MCPALKNLAEATRDHERSTEATMGPPEVTEGHRRFTGGSPEVTEDHRRSLEVHRRFTGGHRKEVAKGPRRLPRGHPEVAQRSKNKHLVFQ